MATLDDALALATEKFRGICDAAGEPYILHCLRVALAQPDEVGRQVVCCMTWWRIPMSLWKN